MGRQQERSETPRVAVQATAVVTGTFLAGAMMGLSLIAVPVLVDINPDPAHLVRQWARLYGYGIQQMPAGAISTTLLYLYAIIKGAQTGRPWRIYAFAAAATMSIVPFTWYVMAPTNNLLFGLNALQGGTKDLGLVHALIAKWRVLHMFRSLFPLLGATLGLFGTLDELSGGTADLPTDNKIFTQNPTFWENYLSGRPTAPPSFFTRILSYHASKPTARHVTAHDAGAGNGPYAALLREHFSNVIVSDIVDSNVTLAESRLGTDGFRYRVAKIEEADDIDEGSVDLVFATNVMHFAEQEVTAKTFARQLRSGGTLVVAAFGSARFRDPEVQSVWQRIMHQAGRGLLKTAGDREFTKKVMERSSGWYNVLPLGEGWERVQRVHLNMGQGGLTDLLPEEEERTERDYTGEGDEVAWVEEDGWSVRTGVDGVRRHFASFPFSKIEPEGYEDLWRELERVLGDREVEAYFPSKVILATRK
ncbi:hypothetical protein QBC47DRAFT_425520 [Echria macrotheca]|uniref:Methyltransferase type 11 domain-containing protein n=1 Tax=Echria macrotheca TaxID=438768 RepID=A0AAJ0B717_9PEZI|nr:hypothetical protein QBC47DRAFT_425520 [Echria macrotheca]